MAQPDSTPNSQQFTYYTGTEVRVVFIDAAGNIVANVPVIVGKLSDSTVITNLTTETNWSSNGTYTGTTITGTYEGQYYQSGNYYYTAYSDNVWKRLLVSSSSSTSGTLTLSGVGKAAMFYDSTTDESGYAVLVTAGEAIAKGSVCVSLIGGTTDKITKCPITGASHSMPVGVALTSAAGDGSTFWMATNGCVQVLPEAGVTATKGNVLVTSTTTAGTVIQYSTVPAGDHWDEVGHWKVSGTGAGVLTLAFIHFN